MSNLDKYKDLLNHQKEGGKEDSDELSQFLRKASNANIPKGKGKEQIWDAIDSQISNNEEANKSFKIWPAIAVAASIALILGFVFFPKSIEPEFIELATLNGEKTEISLPDGSKVLVNANSEVAYNKDWDRTINLKGEAFFEVTKGSTFKVSTPSGTITVLGTSFNVFSRGGDLEVACKTGKVEVEIPTQNFKESITQGEVISFKSDTVKKENYVTDQIGKWHSGEFYFNNRDVQEVINEIERQFDIEVEVEDGIDSKFTGFFLSSDLVMALEMVCLPLDLSYEKTGSKNYLISKNND